MRLSRDDEEVERPSSILASGVISMPPPMKRLLATVTSILGLQHPAVVLDPVANRVSKASSRAIEIV